MAIPWSIAGLVHDLGARGQDPAVIAFGEDGATSWACATVKLTRFRGARQAFNGGFSDAQDASALFT